MYVLDVLLVYTATVFGLLRGLGPGLLRKSVDEVCPVAFGVDLVFVVDLIFDDFVVP